MLTALFNIATFAQAQPPCHFADFNCREEQRKAEAKRLLEQVQPICHPQDLKCKEEQRKAEEKRRKERQQEKDRERQVQQQAQEKQLEEIQRNKAQKERIESLNAIVYDCLKPMTQFLKEVEEADATMTSVQAEAYAAQVPKKREMAFNNIKKNCPSITFYDVNVLDISKIDKNYRIDIDPSNNMLRVNIGVRKDVYIIPIIFTDNKNVAANINRGKQNIKCNTAGVDLQQKRSGLVTQWLLNFLCSDPVVVQDTEAP